MFRKQVKMYSFVVAKHNFLFWKHNAVCGKKKDSNFADIKKKYVSLQT